MLALSNSFVHCFVLCVWVHGSRSCICSRLLLPSLFRLVCCLCASRVVFFSWCCGAPFFCCCCSVFVVGCRLFFWFFPCVLGAYGLARPLLVSPLPPHPPWLVLCAFWSSQCSAGPSLRVSGCICNGPVVIPSIWRVVADWLLSSLLLMATKASALCGALPSPPCCGCCSGASRTCTEVFALG